MTRPCIFFSPQKDTRTERGKTRSHSNREGWVQSLPDSNAQSIDIYTALGKRYGRDGEEFGFWAQMSKVGYGREESIGRPNSGETWGKNEKERI